MEAIRHKIDRFNEYLEQRMPNDEEGIITRMENLQILLAQSGNLLAEAKSLQDAEILQATKAVVSDPEYAGMGISILNGFIKAKCRDLNFLVNSLDRINSAASKQLMSLQVVLSYRKSQMNLR